MAKPLINDTAGGSWQLSATSVGGLSVTFNAAAPVPPFLLADYRGPSTVYELKYIIGTGVGLFFSSGTNVPLEFALDVGSTPNVWLLQAVQGALQTLKANLGPDLVLGALYPNDGTVPVAVQPGGPGNIVTVPQQTDGEKLGPWVAGCSHFFSDWLVVSSAISGVTAALILCPVCGFLQRLVIPYADIHTDQNYIIMG